MSILRVNNLGKSFREYRSEWHRFARWLGLSKRQYTEHWVLRHIGFEIRAGETVGIVGQNGAGKSTLLKMITGTLHPSEGTTLINGRISAILELGMGFNYELPGRENAKHVCGLMGFSADQIQTAMPDIEAFAEIGEYFDEPVRTYSSGMQMRLAFAVATAWRPEILIVDEALSVGDAYFQHKCFQRIREFQADGTSLLLVSHDLGMIKLLCDRAILFEKGLIIKDGPPEQVIDYYSALEAKKENTTIVQKTKGDRFETISGTGEVTFSTITLYNSAGEQAKVVHTGEKVTLKLVVKVNKSVDALVLGCGITDRLGQMMFGTNTWHTNQVIEDVLEGETYRYEVSFLANLGVGSYAVHCSLVENHTHMDKNFEWRDGTLVFNVINVDKEFFVGLMWNEMSFNVQKVIDI